MPFQDPAPSATSSVASLVALQISPALRPLGQIDRQHQQHVDLRSGSARSEDLALLAALHFHNPDCSFTLTNTLAFPIFPSSIELDSGFVHWQASTSPS